MNEWISVKDRKPTKEDSPILSIKTTDFFSYQALHYTNGLDGWGWYEANREYGASLNEGEAHYNEFGGMSYWMPLPEPPKE